MLKAATVALALAILALAPPGFAAELRIAAWNLEHLADADGEGCVGRTGADYEAIARQAAALNADVVALQEVENAAAVRRVFPASDWDAVVSSRPPIGNPRRCWDRREARLGHLATGFAVRRGIAWTRDADLTVLGGNDAFQRWGTGVTVTAGGRKLRLLSVHLRSGCWGAEQDRDAKRAKACTVLRAQMRHLRNWIDARNAEGEAFVILGDFNRRLALPGDWAWRLLSPSSAPLYLLTEGVGARCDPRFPAFIDHLVAGGGTDAMSVPGSFREAPRRGPHPDHCAVSAVFRLGR